MVLKNPWVRVALALAGLAAVAGLGWLLRPVLVPLFFAFTVAYVFDPVVDMLERRKVSRMVSIVMLAVLAIGVALAAPLLLLPSIITQADRLIGIAQERMHTPGNGDFFYSALQRLPLKQIVEGLNWAPEEADYDPLAVIVGELGVRVRAGANDFLESYGSQLVSIGKIAGGGIAGFFAGIGRAIMGAVLTIGNLVLFAVVAGYLLRDYDRIVDVARELVPPRLRERLFGILHQIDDQLRSFMRGQALVCLVLAVIYSFGLTIAGVPFGFALGLFGGAASFVPYLGLILTAAPAAILCIVKDGGIDWPLAIVAATFVGAQMLEGTVITPKVVGEKVGLGPVWVILSVLVFGNALGFLGLLLAVPIAATLKVLVLEGVDEYKKSTLYVDPPAKKAAPAKRPRKTKGRGSQN